MKKNVLIVMIALATILTACSNATTVTETPTETTEKVEVVDQEERTEQEEETTEVVEETPEDTEEIVEESVEEKTEEAEETVEEESKFEGMTDEWAMEKANLAVKAYKELAENKTKDAENNVLYELFTGVTNGIDVTTKDGINLTQTGDFLVVRNLYHGLTTYYFDNYINNDGQYFDFADYISSHDYDEIANYNGLKEAAYDTNDWLMINVVWVEFLSDELTIQNIVDSDFIQEEVKTSGDPIKVAYQCDIYSDGEDTGLKILFDENGNFLNINDNESKLEFVVPFETN